METSLARNQLQRLRRSKWYNVIRPIYQKVQVGNDQEKAQSEID